MRVLIVEDERRLADAVARALRHRAMAVDVAYEGESALRKADLVEYDVVILDRDLPGVHGLDVQDSRVHFEVDAGALDAALRQLTAVGVRSLVSRPPTLEELFLRQYDRTRAAGGSQVEVSR